MNQTDFETQFDSRTLLYAKDYRPDNRPVVVGIGHDCHTPAGHLLLSALCNLLARAHRNIILVGDISGPLECADVFGVSDLEASTAGLILAINPFRQVDVAARTPRDAPLLRIGLGQVEGSWDLHVGASGWMTRFGEHPEAIEPDALWGAALAACLVANCAFQVLLGRPASLVGDFSLWARGATSRLQGPSSGTVDVGRVLQVGAGAVGGALDYWLSLIGLRGRWTVADPDAVSIDNLNRQILFLAGDTAWAGTAANKAEMASRRMGPVATFDPHWYGTHQTVVEDHYDLVLALANERGARALLGARHEPLLHATTSRSWQAQLHRHLPGDDCILCRIPEPLAQMGCSSAPVALGEPDAALPFLSAAAGLLLAAELARVAHSGLDVGGDNFHSLIMRGAQPAVQSARHVCQQGCPKRRVPTGRFQRVADRHIPTAGPRAHRHAAGR